jgi:CHAD domain-containing protein
VSAKATTRSSETLIRHRLSALDRALPGARRGDADAIHQARVATRRLREALPLVVRGADGRKLRKRTRGLTRVLGSVRELDVALMTLDELEAQPDLPRRGLARLREDITQERRLLLAAMLHELKTHDLERLRKKALTAVRRPEAPSTGRKRARRRDPRRLPAAEARAARRAATVRDAIRNAGGIYLPDRLHDVRIAAKKLRYAMEIARELKGSRAAARIRMLKGTQDLLGRMHDLEVLIGRIRSVQGAREDPPSLEVSADLDQIVRRLETECRQLHVQYIDRRRKLLDLCEHVMTVPGREPGAPAA